MKAQPEPSALPPRKTHGYRDAGVTARHARDLVFDRLPPAVRERLTRGVVHGAPEPLLAAPSGRAPLALRATIAALSLAILTALGLAAWGLGDAHARYAFQPEAFAAIYGALFAVAILAGAAIMKLRSFQRGAPFRSGRYLFSLDLVEASGGRLRVTSLDTLRRAEAHPRDVAVVFDDGHTVRFPTGPRWGLARQAGLCPHTPGRREDTAALAERVNEALAAARALAYPADEDKLQRLDPFFEVRMTEDWDAAADTGDRSRSRLGWIAAAAVVAAAPAGIGLLHARNALSDDLMFDEAQMDRPGEPYLAKLAAYAAVGRRHRDEVGSLFVEAGRHDPESLHRYLRRRGPVSALADDALFELAKNDGEALSQYLREGGRHADEADDALFAIARTNDTLAAYTTYLERGKRHADVVRRDLLPEADFAQAARSEMVGSLFSFVRRNPGSNHEDEAWRRIHRAYADALPAFTAAEKPPPDGLHFVEALLAALQDRADPRVTLDVEMGTAALVADQDVTLGAKYGDRYLPAAARFSAASLGDLATSIRTAVGSWFGRALPHAVVEISRPSSEDEGRPRFEIHCTPVAYGVRSWGPPGGAPSAAGGEPVLVTPVVGFLVEVRGEATGRDATISWRMTLEDTDEDVKMLATTSQGNPRDRSEMIDDAFALFLDGVPVRIAASFHQKL